MHISTVYGPHSAMTAVDFSSSNWITFLITPLHDHGLNFTDYEPKVKVLCSAKGILKFLEGHVQKPKELHESHVANGVFMKHGTIDKPETEEEIKDVETKMDTYEQNEAMCKHILVSSVSPHLCSKIKSLTTPNGMWVAVCVNVKNKSILQKMGVKQLLKAMKLVKNSDATAHVSEMEAHFHLLQERVDELATIGDLVGTRTHFILHWNPYYNPITPQFRLLILQIPSVEERPLPKKSLWYSYERQFLHYPSPRQISNHKSHSLRWSIPYDCQYSRDNNQGPVYIIWECHMETPHYINSIVILATSIMELSEVQYEIVSLKDLRLTLIMLMSNSVRHVQLENLQNSHSKWSCSSMQVISESVSTGLRLIGTCKCEESWWKVLCCCSKGWCYLYGKTYFLAEKSETFSHYKEDKAWILNHEGKATLYAHSDCAGEFLSNEFAQNLKERGTQCKLTIHDSPPQMGVSEHNMHILGEAMWTLLIASGLPHYLFAEAMAYACWIFNQMPKPLVPCYQKVVVEETGAKVYHDWRSCQD